VIPPRNSAYPTKREPRPAPALDHPEKLKVLIVDDDITVLTLLEEVFKNDKGLSVVTMSDSEEAYNRLSVEMFDLLITDLVMPKVDGLKLLEHAIDANPELLVVVITGYASLETTLEAIHAGVYDYITKPFRIEEFRLLVNNAAARIRLVNENEALRVARDKAESEARRFKLLAKQQESEILRLREELGRMGELPGQQRGASNPSDMQKRASISSYEKGLLTQGERFDREFQNLEKLFAEGRLTPSEFETARQRLKTLV
jgi:DNA-binding response OmpR family regulator